MGGKVPGQHSLISLLHLTVVSFPPTLPPAPPPALLPPQQGDCIDMGDTNQQESISILADPFEQQPRGIEWTPAN